MKTALLCGIALTCSSVAFAQTTRATTLGPPTMTLTGCVGGGANAQPITLGNAMVVPTTNQPTAGSPSPVAGGVSSPATQPTAGATGTSGTAGTAGAAGTAGTTPTAGTAGTSGTAGAVGATGAAGSTAAGAAGSAGATPTTGASGTAGAAGSTGAAGASGTAGAAAAPTGSSAAGAGTGATAAGTAPAGSSASSVTGYRLSGTDMTGWVGRRVQIVGSVVPAAPGGSVTGTSPTGTATMPEFRVQSVQPISGSCPQN